MEVTIEKALQHGITAHKNGNLKEAEKIYRAILKSQPNNVDANHNLGVLAVSLNKSKEALPFFKTALEANPKITQLWISYVDALIAEKQFTDAENILAQGKKSGVDLASIEALSKQLRSIKSGASPAQTELNRLLNYYKNGQHDDAVQLATSLSKQFPNHDLSWKIMAALLKDQGKLSEAVLTEEKIIEATPNDANHYYNLGNTLLKLQRFKEAESRYKQTIALKVDHADAHNNLGVILKEQDRLDEAERSCRQAIAFNPHYAEAHNNLGVTLQRLGRPEEAASSYCQAIALKLDYVEAHSNLATTLLELARLVEAETSSRQAIILKPDFALAQYNLGNTLLELNRLEEAVISYERAIFMKPDYTEAYNNIGNTLKELGRLEDAESSYRRAIASDSDYDEAHYNLGNVLLKLGRHRDGLKEKMIGSGIISFDLKRGISKC